MSNFFVQDFWQWRYFLAQKNTFYSVREKTLDWWVVLLFIVFLTYLFVWDLTPFYNIAFNVSVNLLLVGLWILVFFLYRDAYFAYRFLPFIFLAFINLLWIIFLSTDLFQTAFLNFDFLFSDNLIAKINLEAYQSIARSLSINFLANLVKLTFLFVFLFLNFQLIKKSLSYLFQKQNTRILFFFVFMIGINLFHFTDESELTKMFKFNLQDETSTNQTALNQTMDNSSSFGQHYWYASRIILTPFWEELIYRYAVFAIFGRKRIFWALIFSVFFFTVIHYHRSDFDGVEKGLIPFIEKIFSPRLFYYIYGSVILVTLYWFFDLNLLFPIFFHFMWNFNAS